MADRGFVSQQWINVQNIPDNIQKNGAQIDPLLRQYIFNGESCEYSEAIRRSLIKFTGAEGIKYIAFLAMIVFISIRSFRKFSEGSANDTAWLAAGALMPAAVITAILVFFYAENEFKKNRPAACGQGRCNVL